MLDQLNWPLFAVITYSFLLLLIIVALILRSRRDVKSRYAGILEEKETKLARMQLDIEETMQALDIYANQLREDWSRLRNDDREVLHRLHKRDIDLEANISALKARVAALEIQLKSTSVRADETMPPLKQEVNEALAAQFRAQANDERIAPQRPETNAPAALSIEPDAPDERERRGINIRNRALEMYESGASPGKIAKKLGMSVYEVNLLVAKTPK